jgi:hypothetical protein
MQGCREGGSAPQHQRCETDGRQSQAPRHAAARRSLAEVYVTQTDVKNMLHSVAETLPKEPKGTLASRTT